MIEMMKKRMMLYQQIRYFFKERNVDEVETPILSHYGTCDPYIDSFSTQKTLENPELFLHTSPEFAMKRLLSMGYQNIYQIVKVFRNELSGSRHNPEFTMLEWYRSDFSMDDLIQEISDLIYFLNPNWQSIKSEKISYKDAFLPFAIHPFKDDLATIKQKTAQYIDHIPKLDDLKDEWLNFLMVELIEPTLGKNKLTYLYHYPPSQASLANICRDKDQDLVAERFELYYNGVELANGFFELTCAKEQEKRFIEENKKRKVLEKPTIPYNSQLIEALKKGIPSCSGVALGIDRLLMLMCNKQRLDDIMIFPIDKA